jgi:hypothetical protein
MVQHTLWYKIELSAPYAEIAYLSRKGIQYPNKYNPVLGYPICPLLFNSHQLPGSGSVKLGSPEYFDLLLKSFPADQHRAENLTSLAIISGLWKPHWLVLVGSMTRMGDVPISYSDLGWAFNTFWTIHVRIAIIPRTSTMPGTWGSG